MGVSGAAMTNVLSQSLGTAIGLWILLTGRSRLRLTFSEFYFDSSIIWRLVKIGIPASVSGMERSLSGLVLMRFMVPFGTVAVAGHTLCQRIEMILFVPVMGLGMGAGVLAGQNLGARQPERAVRSGWLAAGLAEGFIVACSLAILLWAESMVRIFSANPDLVALASTFLRIAVAGLSMMGFIGVFMNCISSAGDTLPPMLVGLLGDWVLQIPLAFFLPRVTNLGVYGVRWAIATSMVVGAVIFITYFQMGRWKHKRV